MLMHFVVKAQASHTPLLERDRCADLWERLRREFSTCLACVLMPDHMHLALDEPDPVLARGRLARVMGDFAKKHSPRANQWGPVAAPEVIENTLHLKRLIRYIHLNPCRDRLVDDPLSWEWSTHRDLVGAVGAPWLNLKYMANVWAVPLDALARTVHAYTSGDPSVKVAGTPLPVAFASGSFVANFDQICTSLASARRVPRKLATRRGKARTLAIHLAHRLGSFQQAELGKELACSRWTLTRGAKKPLSRHDEAAIRAAILILSDTRLQVKPRLGRVLHPNGAFDLG